jgi:hypothetical protein
MIEFFVSSEEYVSEADPPAVVTLGSVAEDVLQPYFDQVGEATGERIHPYGSVWFHESEGTLAVLEQALTRASVEVAAWPATKGGFSRPVNWYMLPNHGLDDSVIAGPPSEDGALECDRGKMLAVIDRLVRATQQCRAEQLYLVVSGD